MSHMTSDRCWCPRAAWFHSRSSGVIEAAAIGDSGQAVERGEFSQLQRELLGPLFGLSELTFYSFAALGIGL